MSKLSEKLRRAREKNIPVREHSFTVLRPTDLDMLEFRGEISPRQLLKFVVGWGDTVTELALKLPGGDPHPLPFDGEALVEWASDDAELFAALINGITGAYADHQAAVAAAKKN